MVSSELRARLYALERHTWLDDDPRAQRHLFEVFVGVVMLACGIIVLVRAPTSTVTVVVGLVVGVAGFVMMVHGSFDLRTALITHRRRQRMLRAQFCPSKERLARPHELSEVLGAVRSPTRSTA